MDKQRTRKRDADNAHDLRVARSGPAYLGWQLGLSRSNMGCTGGTTRGVPPDPPRQKCPRTLRTREDASLQGGKSVRGSRLGACTLRGNIVY